MTAEYIISLLLLVWCAGWIAGDISGRKAEREAAKRRLDRARRIYIGGMRDW